MQCSSNFVEYCYRTVPGINEWCRMLFFLFFSNSFLCACFQLPVIEFLEEKYPAKPLLPRDPIQRAQVKMENSFWSLTCETSFSALMSWLGTGKAYHSFIISGLHHYECIVPNVDIILQSGWFWATSIASFRERFSDSRSCWVVREHTSGLLQFFKGKLLKSYGQ